MSESVTGTAVIMDPTGLHARPAVKISKLAKKFSAEVTLSILSEEKLTNAKSTSEVMKLKAVHGAQIVVKASGIDAAVAVAGIVSLIERNFKDA